MLLSGFVALLLVLTAEAKVGNATGPPCDPGEQCLLYHQIFQNAEVTVRYYDTAMLASVPETVGSLTDGQPGSLEHLMNYFSGANENGTVMAWASPSLIMVPSLEYMENANVTVAMLLTAEHTDKPPIPTNNMVALHAMSPKIVYTRSCSEFSVPAVNATVTALSDYLTLNEVAYVPDYFIVALYVNGATEVWYVADAVGIGPGGNSETWDSLSNSIEMS